MILELVGVAAGIVLIGKAIKDNREMEAEEQRRKNSVCQFHDGISESEFREMVYQEAKRIKRLIELEIDGPIINGTVESQSGLSDWNFKIDFNDYGHISGRYWLSSNNSDSIIPKSLAERISKSIKKKLNNTK